MMERRAFLFLAIGMAMAPVTLTACGAKDDAPSEPEPEVESPIGTPFMNCESAAAAAQLAGFEVTFPESVPGCSERLYQAAPEAMVQCVYSEGDTKVTICKAVSTVSTGADASAYPESNVVQVGDVEVTESGDGDLVFVATWQRGDHAFAITADEGLDVETVGHLVQATI